MSKKKRVIIGCAAVMLALLAGEFAVSNSAIEAEQIEVTPRGLPEEFDGFRILLISDVHGRFSCNRKRLLRVAAEARPDIIAFTGDAINDGEDSIRAEGEFMSALCEIAPVYYVPGNHEYASLNDRSLFRAFREAGAEVLMDDAVTLERGGAKIILAGADDANGYAGMVPLEDSLAGIYDSDAAECKILLCHRYDRAEEASALGFSLMLAGHGHGGLIRLPFIGGLIGPGAAMFPQHTNGYYNLNGMELAVSRGLGNAGGAPRFRSSFHLPLVILRAE